MQRIAFKMFLLQGFESEYQRRHSELWPDLALLLKQTGIQEYSIFLDEKSGELFGYLQIQDGQRLSELSEEPVMKKWWSYMKDIMKTNADHSPLSIPLQEVFYFS
jgi:L-rhamnose mutarotase